MSVGEICNREVVVVEKDTDAREAARLMRQLHVGDLVVVEKRGDASIPVGIVTDRDLVLEVLAEGVEPATVSVSDLLTHPLESAREGDDLFETLHRMRQKGIRRLPVVNPYGVLEGILTMDDVLDLLSEQLDDVVALIANQRRQEEQSRP